jgi:hypothetical protein
VCVLLVVRAASLIQVLMLPKVGMGRDHTLYSLVEGYVQFTRAPHGGQIGNPLVGRRSWRKYVHIMELPRQPQFMLTGTILPQHNIHSAPIT